MLMKFVNYWRRKLLARLDGVETMLFIRKNGVEEIIGWLGKVLAGFSF